MADEVLKLLEPERGGLVSGCERLVEEGHARADPGIQSRPRR